MNALLDNPVWSSLLTAHAHLAIGNAHAKRYPRDVTPFVAVADSAVDASHAAALVDLGEEVCFIAVRPALGDAWRVTNEPDVLQFRLPDHVTVSPRAEGAPARRLGPRDEAAQRALIAAVYPHFFRARMPMLGNFYGVFDGDDLVAIAGERMRVPGFVELSTIITHPRAARRGLAQRLIAALAHDARERGDRVFAHTARGNAPMTTLFERTGWVQRAALPMWTATRVR